LRCRISHLDFEFNRGREARGDVRPIPKVPDGIKEFGFTILILKVISVFPRVEDHQWNTALREIGLVIVNLSDEQPLSHGFPYQPRPTGAHDARSDFFKLPLEGIEAAEMFFKGGCEGTSRSPSAIGSHILPEN